MAGRVLCSDWSRLLENARRPTSIYVLREARYQVCDEEIDFCRRHVAVLTSEKLTSGAGLE